MARLPEGRGFKSGPGAAADQGEFDALRKRLQAVEAEARWTVPPLGMIDANLTDAVVLVQFSTNGLGKIGGTYYGWQICNGNNGSPNVTDKFVRYSTTGLGTTGGADTMAHTHDVDIASFDSGSEAAHTHSTPNHSHAAGSLQADIHLSSGLGKIVQKTVNGATWNGDRDAVLIPSVVADNGILNATFIEGSTASDGSGTTGAGSSHLHTVDPPNTTSTAASNTENRPAYYTLLKLMRVPLTVYPRI